MIHSISSDLPGFKNMAFRPGLNVILADRAPGSSERQTRNGAGKSSFVELVHFLLGATADPKSIFRSAALGRFTFSMSFDLGGEQVEVARSGLKPSRCLVQGARPGWSIQPAHGELSNEQWKDLLGHVVFGLVPADDNEKGNPTFRSLLSYFARRQGSGGFASPAKHAAAQQPGDAQVALTWLLGLDWKIPAAWHQVRERERMLREVKKAAEEGAFGSILGKAADLRAELTVAEERLRKAKISVDSFRVLEQYHELEQEASRLTARLAAIADENALDLQYAASLETTEHEERAPATEDLRVVYSQAGVLLPDAVLRRFDDVARFHESVVANRRAYLASERADVDARIRQRQAEFATADARRAEIMTLLQSRGALESFTKLQAEVGRLASDKERLRQQYENAEFLESGKSELDQERSHLFDLLKRDYREQRDVYDRAVLTFAELSSALYEQAGTLTIGETLNGPEFAVKIHGQASKGIQNMQIFCFDLTLAQIAAERGHGPGFLIHDSHLFDGVDERQVARALEVGARKAEACGFQYIVTMNSDAVPSVFSVGFDLAKYVVDPRLTDATEDGGLFGVRFG